uniref:Bactericidal permeability-increasing protein n=1 Tax=Chelonoidis abingdonii TaxID=106734 RepID=A0A8C0QHG1_CHEAB
MLPEPGACGKSTLLPSSCCDCLLRGPLGPDPAVAPSPGSDTPFSPAPFLLPDEGDHMLLLGLSEFSANSAAFVYFTAGSLRKNFRDDMIPKRSPIRLNTGSVGVFFPEVRKLYPDMPMELHLSARKQPLLTCRPDSLALALFGTAEAFVVLPNATLASAFLLDLVSAGQGPGHPGSLSPRGPGILLPLGSGSSPLTSAPFVSPEKLKKGFPLPSIYNLSLVNPHVKINQVGLSHGLGSTSYPVPALGTPKPVARVPFQTGWGHL